MTRITIDLDTSEVGMIYDWIENGIDESAYFD